MNLIQSGLFFQEEEVKEKPKTQKRSVRTSELSEPELEKDDPLSVLIAVLSQVPAHAHTQTQTIIHIHRQILKT